MFRIRLISSQNEALGNRAEGLPDPLGDRLRIRRMAEADLKQVKAIDALLNGESRAPSWPQSVDAHYAVYHPLLNFVAEVDGEIIGFVLGDIRGAEYGTPMSGWIDLMGVHPAYHRLGLGRRLVAAFCQVCRENQVTTRVIIQEDDARLREFWAAMGFRRGKLIDFEM